MCILLRRDDDDNNNNNNSGDDLSILSFPRNFSWGGRPAPESSEEANKEWLLSARQVDKFSNSVLNYVPQFSFAKEQQQLDDDKVDETT